MATEDANGLHYEPGNAKGTPNDSAAYPTTKGADTPETNSERNSSKGNSVYGDTATQQTPAGDKATPQDTSPKTTTTTSDPAVIDEPDLHI